jgi:hypothetical protein
MEGDQGIMARIAFAKSAARSALLLILVTSACSKREAAKFEVDTCMAHLSEMDAATQAECKRYHTLNMHLFSNDTGVSEDPFSQKLAKNPEDLRLDRRGIK